MNSYDELKAALTAWPALTGEPDIESQADTLIALGEARIWRELRLRDMIVEVPRSGSQIFADQLPDDYLEMSRVLGPDGEALEMRPADELDRWGWGLTYEPAIPRNYAIDGRTIRFSPAVDAYTIRYYQRLPSLQSTGTNWLFAREPGLWLFAALIEAATFHKEAEQENRRYELGYAKIVQGLVAQDEASRHPKDQPLRSMVDAGHKSVYTQQQQ